jgi:aminopeptidase
MEAEQAAKNALLCALEAKEGEKITIICDDTRREVGKAFEKGALGINLRSNLFVLETSPHVFREEISPDLAEYIENQETDIYINLLRGPREETPFRIKLIHRETRDHKTKLGHCPGITLNMLTEGALALNVDEHKKMQDFSQKLIEKLREVVKMEICSDQGTNLSLNVKGRPFFTDTVLNRKYIKWMNLPTGEVIVAPVEDSLKGKLVCDLAIGGIGLLNNPVSIIVKKGSVEAVTCDNSDVLRKVQNSLHMDAMAKIVGEFAFGINPKARATYEFLETEKLFGTIHIAFGNNTDMPKGKNTSVNHMDFMISKPTVNGITADGKKIGLLTNGVFQIRENEVLSDKEKLPISNFCQVIDYINIFKTDLWWEAIVLFEVYGRRQIGMYLWQKKNEKWKRKNKFGIRTLDEWNRLKAVTDHLAQKISTHDNNQI